MRKAQRDSFMTTTRTSIVRLAPWMVLGLIAMPLAFVQAESVSYSFTELVELGKPVPGGILINDFEVGGLNNSGDVITGADIGTSTDPATFFGENVLLLRAGQLTQLARATGDAPGGGKFDQFFLGSTINDESDGAFVFTLFPFPGFDAPCCQNAGLYRYARNTGDVTAVVRPGHTPSPLGGTFPGVSFGASMNNRGDIVFTGIVNNSNGVFVADKKDRISAVITPGDSVPGGGSFDSAGGGGTNQAGDIVFGAHLTGEAPNLNSIYLKSAGTGTIRSIAHAGEPAPRGGTFISAYQQGINDSDDAPFLGLLEGNPDGDFTTMGVYLRSGNTTIAIAIPGDRMPGGGKFVTGTFALAGNVHINNAGQVVFNAKLDTDDNHDGLPDTGLYVWSHGLPQLVARSGTVVPGVGTIAELKFSVILIPPPSSYVPDSGAVINDRGQVVFGVKLTDGRRMLLLATPHGGA